MVIPGALIETILITIVAVISALALSLFIQSAGRHVKFMIVLAFLVVTYSLGKVFHLSTLLLIFVFGIILNNLKLAIRGPVGQYLAADKIEGELPTMRVLTSEVTFLVRTFFFLIFGYSIDTLSLLQIDVLVVGTMVLAIIMASRYLHLRIVTRTELFPGLFVTPRGLITILLYMSIPAGQMIDGLSHGVLFFIVIATSLIMMGGLMNSEDIAIIGIPVTEETA